MGEKLCIVSSKPQTTRHRILGILTQESNDSSSAVNNGDPSKDFKQKSFQLIFSDTPGMLEPAYKLQEAMQETVHSSQHLNLPMWYCIEQIRGAVGDADLILLVTDVFGEALLDQKVMQKLSVTSRPVVVVVNKIDLLNITSSTTIYPEPALVLIQLVITILITPPKDFAAKNIEEKHFRAKSESFECIV